MTHFGAIIIGDEILSGKRQDQHFGQIVKTLGERGLELSWCQYLGDDPQLITATLRRTLATPDIVFSFGGIGATPDDHTRRCAAKAAGVELYRHPDALAEIVAQFGEAAYPKRVLMADLPQDSRIIPNPYNRVPGFSLNHHHFLPGFPEMAWPMLEWVLDAHYLYLQHRTQISEQAILVHGARESLLLDLMNDCVARFPELKLFSLPHLAEKNYQIELGVRGDVMRVPEAMQFLKQGVVALGFQWEEQQSG
ncbi:MAG TPA: molybdopterin-binding protein [Burkholderiales bacterium]|nr:molybdopterin-binding protein [Burkholderiales bacterium]